MKSVAFLATSALLVFPAAAEAANPVYEAEAARLNSARVAIVPQESFHGGQGVALAPGISTDDSSPATDPDLTIVVQPPRAGRYRLTTYAATDAVGAELMKRAKSKFESLYARLQIGDRPPTRRVIYVPWASPQSCVQHAGVFEFSAGPQDVRFWLPRGVRLDRIELQEYRPPAVPREAENYRPAVVPPPGHPRLWVDPVSLSQVRAHLEHPENLPYWSRVRAAAAKPFAYAPPGEGEVPFNTPLEQAALARAFVYLVRADVRAGREAAALMLAYLPRVEFGNLLDITREVGAAIYAGSCVYDWCHGLLSPEERALLRRHLLRLAEEMECGWPPFRQGIVNGHGNEAQICRDLLSLAIAIHDEDPQPYRYCAYAVLEQLVPMRRFEYQSPRHNQGISYGAYRFGWEMHAAWLMRRIAGREVFAENLKQVPNYWLHFRLPNGEMLRDGDGVPTGSYWSYAQTALLCYAYNRDPVLKGEFQRQASSRVDPILFLLLNDPGLRAEPDLNRLPRTIDFGPVLGGMVARTGWQMGADSPEVVAEIRGGGHHFGNHQHADAGSIQVYFRGLQVARLAQYKFYGTPYDLNFAKRSVAQCMLFVHDPAEKIPNGLANDGGTRFVQAHPRTPKQAKEDPQFNYGRVVSCSFGPSAETPEFSYFSADLRGAYSDKVATCLRRFCFLNLQLPGHPAAMILLDDLAASRPNLTRSLQLNTLKPPQLTPEGVRFWNESGGKTGYLDVKVILPAPGERTLEVLSGPAVHTVDGRTFSPPSPEAPEAGGHRIVVTPAAAGTATRFLTVLQACDQDPLPVRSSATATHVAIAIADRLVILPPDDGLLAKEFTVAVPENSSPWHTVIAGLAAGEWKVEIPGAEPQFVAVGPGKNTLQLESRPGTLRLAPRSR
ncbi:MAG: hypothetical protein HZC55_09970 [Verrucomicrobia bacterium]|nr:hypothetical protein [Verrucomicrobiota bacterium]